MKNNVDRKLLFNPGPATTTDSVKLAQVVSDICPRESEFKKLTANIRSDLLKIIYAKDDEYMTVMFCGSGTSIMESVISSVVNYEEQLLIIINGAYGKRMQNIAELHSIDSVIIEFKHWEPIDFKKVELLLEQNKKIGTIAMVHHETTSGILNSIKEFSNLCCKFNKISILDAISSYAGLNINIQNTPIDFLLSTSNKCIQGMPGISFSICNKKKLESLSLIKPRSYYLSLYDEYINVDKNGESRFTPPVQVLYALRRAIDEYFNEGAQNRFIRYQNNMKLLRQGLRSLGFHFLVDKKHESGILLTIKEPTNSNYNFQAMHDFLYDRGITVYPGKIMHNNTFRLAVIGDLKKKDIQKFLMELKSYLIKSSVYENLYT